MKKCASQLPRAKGDVFKTQIYSGYNYMKERKAANPHFGESGTREGLAFLLEKWFFANRQTDSLFQSYFQCFPKAWNINGRMCGWWDFGNCISLVFHFLIIIINE